MINNLSDHFGRLFGNRNNKNSAGASSDLVNKLKEKHAKEAGADSAQADAAAAKKARPNYIDQFTRAKEGKPATETADTAELSPEEKRKAQLQKILEQLDAEEAARSSKPAKTKTDSTDAKSEVVTATDPSEIKEKEGIGALLNDMPLFNEFKTSLMSAFRSMDSATYGSISAQYELNYSSMQYIANAAGGYEYQETNFSIKLDLNYIKAGAGGTSGAEIADAIENAEDFESFVAALQGFANQGQAAAETGKEGEAAAADSSNPLSAYLNSDGKPMSAQQLMNSAFKNVTPENLLKGLTDYFSPEKTAGRIVDFATAFFPLSDAFKKGGDTPEARKEFGELMRGAIQKGFDQARGALGPITGDVKDGVDKTHELAMKGIDDFIANGMKKEKEPVYDSLAQFAMSFEMSYSHKSVTVGYGSHGEAQTAPQASSLNTEA